MTPTIDNDSPETQNTAAELQFIERQPGNEHPPASANDVGQRGLTPKKDQKKVVTKLARLDWANRLRLSAIPTHPRPPTRRRAVTQLPQGIQPSARLPVLASATRLLRAWLPYLLEPVAAHPIGQPRCARLALCSIEGRN